MEEAQLALRDAGDEEGTLAYDPEVEIFVEGQAVAGMSGGAAFDVEGRLVGILVRASTADLGGPSYVRAVRMTFVTAELTRTFDTLDPASQDVVRTYLEVAEP